MTIEELKAKASSLPLEPGVYIMKDRDDRVIYVGKAKKLKNRVSQYFQDTASHSPKTRLMVSKIDHFDVFVASSEFEALVLECAQIKQHMPKYNILLKDDKGYPYIRLDNKGEYPGLSLASRIVNDGALYFGPYGSRGITQGIIRELLLALKLPSCSRKFPEDIGKDRPCLHYHMNQCSGWCTGSLPASDYAQRMHQARQLLSGNFKKAADQIRQEMLSAAQELNFELAASLRDRLNTLESLGNKQLVSRASHSDVDAIGYGYTESKACFAVLHFQNGALVDKEYECFPLPEDHTQAICALTKQFYFSRGFAPKTVLIPSAFEDSELFAQLLSQQFGHKVSLRVPQRGDGLSFVTLANKNAFEEAHRVTSREERSQGVLLLLQKMLQIDKPVRIESFDISNISGTDTVGSMVVFRDGKPCKSEYKHFKIRELTQQDDYQAMYQMLHRRFTHYLEADPSFTQKPDLLLIDGGLGHVGVAQACMTELSLNIPVFGMVKDDRHRTRALISSSGAEIRIDNQQAVFSFIGSVQEETHRFAITYHRKLRSKRLRASELDQIPGVGPKRKELLLKRFSSVKAIRNATQEELEQVLPKDAAMAVFHHFQKKE